MLHLTRGDVLVAFDKGRCVCVALAKGWCVCVALEKG